MSFGDIGKIINRIDGRDNDDRVEAENRYQKQVQRHTGSDFYFQWEKDLLTLR